MKHTVTSRFMHWVLSLLGLAGFMSCAMYGMPHADYIASGKVVDQKGKPIKDIVITTSIAQYDGKVSYSPYDTVHTRADGSFYMKWQGLGEDLYLLDEDGPANGGEFETQRYELKDYMKKIKRGSGNWYHGVYEAKDLVIELEEKKAE